jgi:hypothetical protein
MSKLKIYYGVGNIPTAMLTSAPGFVSVANINSAQDLKDFLEGTKITKIAKLVILDVPIIRGIITCPIIFEKVMMRCSMIDASSYMKFFDITKIDSLFVPPNHIISSMNFDRISQVRCYETSLAHPDIIHRLNHTDLITNEVVTYEIKIYYNGGINSTRLMKNIVLLSPRIILDVASRTQYKLVHKYMAKYMPNISELIVVLRTVKGKGQFILDIPYPSITRLTIICKLTIEDITWIPYIFPNLVELTFKKAQQDVNQLLDIPSKISVILMNDEIILANNRFNKTKSARN